MTLPPFYIGQKVVCIEPSGLTSVGVEYIIKNIMTGCEHHKWIVDVGLVHDKSFAFCPTCLFTIPTNVAWMDAKRFAPIKSDLVAITLTKILETETPLISVQ